MFDTASDEEEEIRCTIMFPKVLLLICLLKCFGIVYVCCWKKHWLNSSVYFITCRGLKST